MYFVGCLHGNGAFALARATGYRVMRRSLKQGPVLSCGFPLASLQNVKSHIRKAGGIVREEDSGMLVFYGIDGTPDETLVASDAPSSPLASCLPNPMH